MAVSPIVHAALNTGMKEAKEGKRSVALAELRNFIFESFSYRRDERLREVLAENGLSLGRATTTGNNCLLDTVFQQIPDDLKPDDFTQFAKFVREEIDKTNGEQLSINDETEGVQILAAAQAYLFEKKGVVCCFDLTVLLADNDGEVGYVDMSAIENAFRAEGEVISVRIVVVNYNHYLPLFEKDRGDLVAAKPIEGGALQGSVRGSHTLKGDEGLRPLEENPILDFKHLGFALVSKRANELREQYPEWVEALERGLNGPRKSKNYKDAIEHFKARLGLSKTEESQQGWISEHLLKIEEAARVILEELSKETPDLDTLAPFIEGVRDHAYELFIDPERDVRACINSSFSLFWARKKEFRKGLQEVSEGVLSDRMLKAMESWEIDQEKEKLIREYPAEEKMVIRLADMARQLLINELERATQEIKKYQNHPEVSKCYQWFLLNPHLAKKYVLLMDNRYLSPSDCPKGGFYTNTIYFPSYIPRLSELVVACQKLQKKEVDKGAFERYLLHSSKGKHLQEVLVPLAFFLEAIDGVLLWPQVYEPSDGEWGFLKYSIMLLKGIANQNLPGNFRIPYEYLSITNEKVKEERALLGKKVDIHRKRTACRYLYHSQIPWKALRAIGNLTHRSGGVSEKEASTKEDLLRSTIVDIRRELPQVKRAICSLIDFELSEFDSEPSVTPPPRKAPSYNQINLLGNFEEARVHLKECLDVLNSWDNLPLISEDFANPKIQFAILRTVQVVGEVTKNIREIGILGVDSIWGIVEKMRDTLSHSERTQTATCLKELLGKPEGHRLLKEMVDDFRFIRDVFQERYLQLKECSSWEERLNYLRSNDRKETFIELPALKRLFLFFNSKISSKKQQELIGTILSEDAQDHRSKVTSITQTFLRGVFDLKSYGDLVELLPLAKIQKQEVKNTIKRILSPKAAANDARDIKSSILKT